MTVSEIMSEISAAARLCRGCGDDDAWHLAHAAGLPPAEAFIYLSRCGSAADSDSGWEIIRINRLIYEAGFRITSL